MTRILIADDHHLVRQGIKALLEAAPDLEVVGEADSGSEAVSLARSLSPDVLILDITMPGIGGMEALEMVVSDPDHARVVVLSMHDDESLVRRAMRLGANAYVLKGSVVDELLLAVRAAARGGTYLSKSTAENILTASGDARDDEIATLTPREREVLRLVGQGETNRAIASHMHVSVKTVERHRSSLMKKLDARSVVDLIRIGIRAGLIDLVD